MSRSRRIGFVVAFGSFALPWLLIVVGIILGTMLPEAHWFGAHYAIRVDDGKFIVWRNLSRWIVIDFFGLAGFFLPLSGFICSTLGIIWQVQDLAARREERRNGFEVIPNAKPMAAPGEPIFEQQSLAATPAGIPTSHDLKSPHPCQPPSSPPSL